MTEQGKFGANKPSVPSGNQAGQLDCAGVELWLAEAAEESLPLSVKQHLRDHAAGCAACREKLERARRGREWLVVLKQETLEPPADMVAKILAKTSLRADGKAGAKLDHSARPARDFELSEYPTISSTSGTGLFGREESGSRIDHSWAEKARRDSIPENDLVPSGAAVPAWQRDSVVVLRRTLLEPRLALVAAMAFFSITLTLNLMGVRLTNMHVSDLQPQNLSRAVTRQYADANARMVRYYENLRIVYEVESRVQQIRRAAQTTPQPQQTSSKPRKRSSNSDRDSGSDQTESHREGMAVSPEARGNKHAIAPQGIPDPIPVVTGPRLDAAFRPQSSQPHLARNVWEQYSIEQAFVQPGAIPAIIEAPLQPASQGSSCAPRTVRFSMRRFATRERRLA